MADFAEFVRHRSLVVLFREGPLVQVLRDRGVAVQVVALPKRGADVQKTSGASAYARAALSLLPFLWRVGRTVGKYDLLYANTMKALVVAAILGFCLRKRFCFHLHDVLSASHFGRLNCRLAVFLANRATLVIANSRASADAYRAAGGRNAKVLYNGFRLDRFAPVSPEAAQAALPVLLRGKSPIVGLFGRVTRWKGQHVLIKALTALPGVNVLIVGDALFTAEDHLYRRELKVLADRLGVGDRVHFAGFRADVTSLYCAVNVVAHCSVAPEPFGRVIVEAMLLGRPVVATGQGGVPELVQEGRTGLLIAPADALALAYALRSLLQHPDRAAAMGQAARAEAHARFGLPSILSEWDRWIGQLLPGAGVGSCV